MVGVVVILVVVVVVVVVVGTGVVDVDVVGSGNVVGGNVKLVVVNSVDVVVSISTHNKLITRPKTFTLHVHSGESHRHKAPFPALTQSVLVPLLLQAIDSPLDCNIPHVPLKHLPMGINSSTQFVLLAVIPEICGTLHVSSHGRGTGVGAGVGGTVGH